MEIEERGKGRVFKKTERNENDGKRRYREKERKGPEMKREGEGLLRVFWEEEYRREVAGRKAFV